MADNDESHEGVEDQWSGSSGTLRKRKETAVHLLARAALEDAIGMDGMNQLRNEQAICVVVQAPAADWVGPLHSLIRTMGEWEHQVDRTSRQRPSAGSSDNEYVVDALASGGRVLGVSQAPDQLLPSALLVAADRRIVLKNPGSRVIGAVIRAVTGVDPGELPKGIGSGLGLDELASCIRQNSTVEQCLARLERASRERTLIDPLMAPAPRVQELHGYGPAKEWAMDLVADLDRWRRGEIEFDRIDRNVVLVSPPGMGRSTFARSLARSTGIPLIATSVGSWFANSPGYLDSVIKEIDKTFAAARAVSPAIILLDELDSVPNRATISPRGADWWLPVITHLLLTLDSAISTENNQLVVIGATNHGDRIDAALTRPGRLSRKIVIPLPGEEDLRGIIRQHLGEDLIGIDLSAAARLATGGTGAEVVQWIKDARRRARNAERPMQLEDLLRSIAPAEKRSSAELRRVAVHEAGHGIAAHVLGIAPVVCISIVQKGSMSGFTEIAHDGRIYTREQLEDLIVHWLAGRAAEEVLLGEPGLGAGGSARSDLGMATRHLGMLHLSNGLGEKMQFRADENTVGLVLLRDEMASDAVEADLRRLYARSLALIHQHAELVRTLSEALLARQRLNTGEFLVVIGADPSRSGEA